jgi:YHS domain-containing protein
MSGFVCAKCEKNYDGPDYKAIVEGKLCHFCSEACRDAFKAGDRTPQKGQTAAAKEKPAGVKNQSSGASFAQLELVSAIDMNGETRVKEALQRIDSIQFESNAAIVMKAMSELFSFMGFKGYCSWEDFTVWNAAAEKIEAGILRLRELGEKMRADSFQKKLDQTVWAAKKNTSEWATLSSIRSMSKI